MDSLTQSIVAWLKEAAAKLGDVEIAADTELIEQGVLDSLEILRLVSFLEERFHLALDEHGRVMDVCRSGQRRSGVLRVKG